MKIHKNHITIGWQNKCVKLLAILSASMQLNNFYPGVFDTLLDGPCTKEIR